MNIKTMRGVVVATLGLAVLGATATVWTARAQGAKKQPEPTGKITPWAAIKIALAKTPGKALNANFEFDEGKWVYGVMVVNGATLKEVEIDPTTGKVGDVETVTPEGEAKETQAELTAAIGGKAPAGGEKDEKDEKPEKK